MSSMAWSRTDFQDQYTRLAPLYDAGMWLYRVAGLRDGACRQRAVNSLRLSPGATVVDLGCGTGLNFPYLRDAVGPGGRIIGVDLTPAMLARAGDRVRRHGWRNVELVEADMSHYRFPEDADGVVATLALSTVPDYEAVVARAADTLPAGARMADFELKWPERWPGWLAGLAAWLNRPAGVTPDIVNRNPASAMRRVLTDVSYREVYFGAAYICSGTVPG